MTDKYEAWHKYTFSNAGIPSEKWDKAFGNGKKDDKIELEENHGSVFCSLIEKKHVVYYNNSYRKQ